MRNKIVIVILSILFLFNIVFCIINTSLLLNKEKDISFDGCYKSIVELKITYDNIESYGSAICMNDNSLLTNWHIISNVDSKIYYRSCYDIEYKNANLISYDIESDLALLEINDNTIKPLIISKSDVNNGETVYSIGNTLNQGITISKGIVSNSSVSYNSLKYICTDNIIDYGNSGGALLNSSMELIGITTFKISNNGYSYSIPLKRVLGFIENN